MEAPGHKQPIARIEPVHEETAMAVAQSNSGEPAVATFFADMNCEGCLIRCKHHALVRMQKAQQVHVGALLVYNTRLILN